MNCTNCGNTLDDNAKFCQACGTPVSTSGTYTAQQPVNMTVPVQQQAYNANPIASMQQKNKTTKIISGVAIGILLIVIFALVQSSIEREDELDRYQNQLYQYQYQLDQYENRNSIDKTIDAIGSWLE